MWRDVGDASNASQPFSLDLFDDETPWTEGEAWTILPLGRIHRHNGGNSHAGKAKNMFCVIEGNGYSSSPNLRIYAVPELKDVSGRVCAHPVSFVYAIQM